MTFLSLSYYDKGGHKEETQEVLYLEEGDWHHKYTYIVSMYPLKWLSR